jgi:hypothetical protein
MADGSDLPLNDEMWLLRPPPGTHVIDTGAARWWKEDDKLICNQSYKKRVTVDDIHGGFDAARELVPEGKMVLIAESGPMTDSEREARQALSGPRAAELYIALAVIVRSPVARTIMNLFTRFYSPPFPVRCFSDAARSWARSIRDHG